MLFPQPRQLRLQIVSLGVAGGKLLAILCDRHKLHKDDHLAAAVGQRLKERFGGDLPDVLGRHGDGRAVDQSPAVQLVHVLHQAIVDPLAAARVGHGLLALDAHDRDEVAAAVEQVKIPLVHEGAVGKDREQDVGALARRLDDVPPQHGFAACEQDKADAELVGFAEDLEPFLAGQLLHGRGVHGRVVAAGIAARAMQVALARDACDQKRGNVQSVILSLPALSRRGGGGGGKAQHERAPTRIRQRRLHKILHEVFDSLGQIRLQVKRFAHSFSCCRYSFAGFSAAETAKTPAPPAMASPSLEWYRTAVLTAW